VGCAESALQLTEQILKHINGHRGNESNHLLHMAKTFILDNIGNEHLDLATVSNHVGLSRVYFCKLFHQMEGISFSTYLKRVRIEKAKQLLLSTNMKVFEVSNAVGFSHSKYFGYVFKEVVGQTPAAYQRNEKFDT
jgi:two-component system response regulator YesN